MSATWIEVRITLPDHRKAKAAARQLALRRPWLIGHLVCLWAWAMENVPADGSLAGIDDVDLEDAAQWPEDRAGELVPAMVGAGFIDVDRTGRYLHDWEDYTGRLLRRREEDRARKAADRAAQRAAKTSTDAPNSARKRRKPATASAAGPADKPARPADKPPTSSGQRGKSSRAIPPARGRPAAGARADRTLPHRTVPTSSVEKKGGSNRARAASGAAAAGTPHLSIEPDDERYPVAKQLATRFGWTACSDAEWADWWEEIDNEYPAGTARGRDRKAGWTWLAAQLRAVPRDVRDPKRWFFEQRQAVKAERQAAADARLDEHEATKGAELHPSIAAAGMPDSKVNGSVAPARMTRGEEREYLLSIEGTLEAEHYVALLAKRGWTLEELHGEPPETVDFDPPPEAAHG